jgi:7-cyano-7-deazaguanine synthase
MLAAWIRPGATLFIDYGQRPAAAERRAARVVAEELSLPFNELSIDLSAIGSGLLIEDGAPSAATSASPSPEWWPLRNQLLCTIAAAWALKASLSTVLVASVAGDGRRHVDGTAEFYEALDAVTSMQEGSVRIVAPAIDLEPDDLVLRSGVTESVLAWTHSCHRSNVPCADCPGCSKRDQVLTRLGMLGFGRTAMS